MPEATRARIEEYKRKGAVVVSAAEIGDLARRYTPDFASGDQRIGFIHRRLADADIYFVVNTANTPVRATLRAHTKYGRGESWDASSGAITAAPAGDIGLDLAPYESRILVFTSSSDARWPEKPGPKQVQEITFMEQNKPATPFFSGVRRYEGNVNAGPNTRQALLDFGEGAVLTPHSLTNVMRAWLDSPVREAAVVYVNGDRAGSVWKPPYQVDITRLVHPGSNTIRVDVGNLAINELAGQPEPKYRILKMRYGDRFQPQDMDRLEPLASGLIGPVRLITR